MSILPENTPLGMLHILEIYDYYDYPILFACQNRLGHIYLAILDNKDENGIHWIYAPLSQERFYDVRSGAVDLNLAFAEVEDKYLYEIYVPYSETQSSVIAWNEVSHFDSERFPLAGEKLDLTTETLPKLYSPEILASQLQRDVINLRLEFGNRRRTEAPAQQLGVILNEFQRLMNSLAVTSDDLYRESTRVPKGLQSAVELSVIAVGAGSFEVSLASPASDQLDMFNEDIIPDSLDKLSRLLLTDATPEDISEIVRELTSRVASRYLDFLNSIKSKIDETKLDWASAKTDRKGSISISSPYVIQTIDILTELSEKETNRLEFTGTLLGFDIKARSFRIEWRERDIILRGKVSRMVTVEDFDFMQHVTLSRRYNAVVMEELETKLATGETKPKYTLLQLSDVNEN